MSLLLDTLVIVPSQSLNDVMDACQLPLLWYPLTEEMRLAEEANSEKLHGKRGGGEMAFSIATGERPAPDSKGIDFLRRRAEVKVLFNDKGKHSAARVGAMSSQYRKTWRTNEMRRLVWCNPDIEHALYDDINVNDYARLIDVLRNYNVCPNPHDLCVSADIDWLVIHGKTAVGQLVVHRSIVNDVFELESITQNRLKIAIRHELRTDMECLMKEGPRV